MARKHWFHRRTALQLALERGTRPGADLADELRELRDYSITSRADAEAVCALLARLVTDDAQLGGESALDAVIGLFHDVEGNSCPAYAIMAEKGIPILVKTVDAAIQDPTRRDPDD